MVHEPIQPCGNHGIATDQFLAIAEWCIGGNPIEISAEFVHHIRQQQEALIGREP